MATTTNGRRRRTHEEVLEDERRAHWLGVAQEVREEATRLHQRAEQLDAAAGTIAQLGQRVATEE